MHQPGWFTLLIWPAITFDAFSRVSILGLHTLTLGSNPASDRSEGLGPAEAQVRHSLIWASAV